MLRPSVILATLVAGCAGETTESPHALTEPRIVVAYEIGFAKRNGERAMGIDVSPGLDIDGRISDRSDVDGCRRVDFVTPSGTPGVDNNFTFIYEAIESLYQSGTVEALTQESIREGRLLLMAEVSGLDDLENDDSVQVRLFSGLGAPLHAAGVIVSDQTFDIKPDAPVSVAQGSVTDGVLRAGPLDVTVPVAILNVFFDMVITDGRLEATLSPEGEWDMTLGGAISTELLLQVAAQSDALNDAQVGPLLESFLPLWVDLQPDDGGACQAISANLVIRTTNAFLYPDATFE